MGDSLFYYLAIVPALGIAAQWVAWRFRLPSILLLLIFGIGLGQFLNIDRLLDRITQPENSGEVHAEKDPGDSSKSAESGSTVSSEQDSRDGGNHSKKRKPRIAELILFPLVSLSVAIVMFEGGLSLRLRELNESGRTVLQLVTVGALVTFALTAFLAWWVLDLHPRIAALIGGVLVVTGPTVVIPLLRHIRPSRNVGSVIKWEGIIIDPIGAILTVLIYEQLFVGLHEEHTVLQSMFALLKTAMVGVGFGWLGAWSLVQLVKRQLLPDFLHGVFFLATALATFALSNLIQEESGLVTVTLMGIILANQKQISIEHVFHFKENLRVFLISCLFIVLGSRIDLSAILEIGWRGPVFLMALILIVRPLAVLVSTLGTGTQRNERLFLALLAPRGIVAAAVSSVFALKIVMLASEGGATDLVRDAEKIVPITFLVIFGTVTVYGLAAAPVAKLLGLDDSNPQGILFAGADRWICDIASAIQEAGFAVLLVDNSYRKVADARMKGLNSKCISILAEQFIEENDFSGIGRLVALTRSDEVNALASNEFAKVFGRGNVYQLPLLKTGSRSAMGDNYMARKLFHPELTFDKLHELYDQGWQIKTTRLTEEFQFADFQSKNSKQCHVLFVISGKTISIVESDQDLLPLPGQTLISLVKVDQVRSNGTSDGTSEKK